MHRDHGPSFNPRPMNAITIKHSDGIRPRPDF